MEVILVYPVPLPDFRDLHLPTEDYPFNPEDIGGVDLARRGFGFARARSSSTACSAFCALCRQFSVSSLNTVARTPRSATAFRAPSSSVISLSLLAVASCRLPSSTPVCCRRSPSCVSMAVTSVRWRSLARLAALRTVSNSLCAFAATCRSRSISNNARPSAARYHSSDRLAAARSFSSSVARSRRASSSASCSWTFSDCDRCRCSSTRVRLAISPARLCSKAWFR